LSLEKGDLLPVLLMLPSVLLIAFVMLTPLAYGFYLSLFDFNCGRFVPARDFLGLGNYTSFIKDPTAWRSILNTVLFSAGALASLRRITFPLLADVYVVIILISGGDTIKIFDIIYSLTGGGPYNSTVSISMYAFNQAFMQSNLSYAMTLSVVAMVVMFVIFGVPFIRRNRLRSS